MHEECLTGLAAWKAATFPTPLAWGASFDPELVEQVGAAIGGSMRQLGVHQGLAPVLDVVRDPRWGRVDECIGEDPYLVGTVGTAYVRGVQSAGVDATLKHFLGYSGSQAGRNHAPVHAGPREVADVYLPPFEMALLDGGARSVMNSYAEVDGVPVAANGELLTGLLRDRLGFDGTVVADYFSVAFLEVMHGIAADRGEAAALALEAGIDVELPTGDAYLAPLIDRVRSGSFDEALVDRAVERVLRQKERLGLLDPDVFEDEPPTGIDLDTPEHQDLARRLATESLVLLSNDVPAARTGADDTSADRSADRHGGDGRPVLPLRPGSSVAVIGPNADRAEALQGCYSFANHVLASHPTCRSASRSRPSARPSPRPSARPPSGSPPAAGSPAPTAAGSPTRSPSPGRRTSPWSSSVTRPDCSAGARSVRATTPSRSTCPCAAGAGRGRRRDGHADRRRAPDRSPLRDRLGTRR